MGLLEIKDAVAGIAEPVGKIIDDLHSSKVEKAEAMAKLQSVLNEANVKVEEIGMTGIEAEAKSDSWIARNWRPIGSLVFIAIVPAILIGAFIPVTITVGGVATQVLAAKVMAEAIATIPGIVWTMIGGCFAGYAALRSLVDKPLKAGTYNEIAGSMNNKKAQRKLDKQRLKMLKKGFSAEEISEVLGEDD